VTTPDQRTEQTVLYFLRHPRGRYFAERAAQLSGIPLSTLYDWRRREVYMPDFSSASPAIWSYRDLVFVRLLVWLRQIGMPRPLASEMVGSVRAFAASGEQIRRIRADRYTLLINEETNSRFKDQPNLLPFDNIYELFRTFDILEPIDEFRTHGQRRMWAPHLVTPSQCTRISPFVLAGDPCINRTRIPTSAIFGLREERGLSSSEIVRLYPGLAIEAADDAYLLERRLRGSDLPDIVSV
jgi:uncharacterized protein (DUF433 family)